jgi:hypothetical protein
MEPPVWVPTQSLKTLPLTAMREVPIGLPGNRDHVCSDIRRLPRPLGPERSNQGLCALLRVVRRRANSLAPL